MASVTESGAALTKEAAQLEEGPQRAPLVRLASLKQRSLLASLSLLLV